MNRRGVWNNDVLFFQRWPIPVNDLFETNFRSVQIDSPDKPIQTLYPTLPETNIAPSKWMVGRLGYLLKYIHICHILISCI